MIKEKIKIHDKYQFELKLGYKVFEGNKNTLYNIEIYFFLPNNLDINRHTYTKNNFYNDLQTYIRFKTPSFILRNIINGQDSPYNKLKLSFENLSNSLNKETIDNYIHQIKMFGCIIKSSLRDHIDFISDKTNNGDMENLIIEYAENIKNIRLNLKELRGIINTPNMSEKLFSYYLFCDEYISHIIEENSYKLLKLIETKNLLNRVDLFQRIYNIINDEITYRKINNKFHMPNQSSDNEELIFRKSVLKKFIGSVLFLKTMSERPAMLLEQILFGLAAGASMIFATAVAFYSQIKYGALSVPLFILLTLSYILKDRIKELLRLFFSNQIQKIFFDHKINIYTSEKKKLGWSKESFCFIKSKNIPQVINKIRNRDHITEIENGWVGEKTILYVNKIKLFSKKINDIYNSYNIEGINNIMRFDISNFLNRMDNPQKEIFILNDNSYKEIYGERVYHVNLVVKYSTFENTIYKRFRIVLNKNGIKRIEEVFTEKENGR